MIALLLALLGPPACHPPRDGGKLARSRASVRDFRKTHPCPSTGKTAGACPGWVVDHLAPLCSGGADAPKNMIWEPYAESKEKDKIEVALCKFIVKECAR